MSHPLLGNVARGSAEDENEILWILNQWRNHPLYFDEFRGTAALARLERTVEKGPDFNYVPPAKKKVAEPYRGPENLYARPPDEVSGS